MLIDVLVDYCDRGFSSFGNKCGSGTCNHPSGKCSGCCYNCLYQIHYPEKFADRNAKMLYDCPKMLYHYVCQYSYLYASELLHAFNAEVEYLSDYPYYHIMSIGCGGCADLMAMESFCNERKLNQPISYIGIDVNKYWSPIHKRVERYCDVHNIKQNFICEDAFKLFRRQSIRNTNMLIISYFISYLYNSGQINSIDLFIDMLVKNIIMKKKRAEKLLLIVNDLNTYKKGRDYFSHFNACAGNH